MISVRESYHDVAGLLRNLVERNRVVLEDVGGNERHLVSQKSVAFAFVLLEKSFCETFKAPSMLRGNRVPAFRRPKMEVIDGIQVHVFCVPRKRSFPHSKV